MKRALLSLSILCYIRRQGKLEGSWRSELCAAIDKQLAGAKALMHSEEAVTDVSALIFKPPGSSCCYTFLYPLPKTGPKASIPTVRVQVALPGLVRVCQALRGVFRAPDLWDGVSELVKT